jgi:diguanylate cyclase (GGDEF)-like protein
VAGASGQPGMYAILDFARLPMAVMHGAGQIICYVNAAFCQLAGKSREEMIGKSCAELMPEGDECLLQLDRVYHTGNTESHTEQEHAKPHPLYWSYEIWPVLGGLRGDGYPVGVILQVTETAPLHRRASVMNEALLVSAVRQHELMEGAEALNVKLQAEIQERQRAEAAIEQLAFYDPLTDLPNRRLLMDRLHLALLACCRTMHRGAILFIDLDQFKILNDTQGHHLGDLLLQQVGHRLAGCVRACDTVARLGGDEFVVMLQELSEDPTVANSQAKKVGTKVLDALNEPYLLAGYEHRCTGSIGITLFGKDRESVEDLLKRADLAQYRAKTAGGSTIQFFDPEMQHTVTARAVLEADLRRGLHEGQFLLHYQPQVDCEGHLSGVEALLRWQHPTRGLLSPAEFIIFAEGNGLIESIGQWVVEAACVQLMAWSLRPETADLTLAINISAREFSHPQFVTRMLTIIDEVGADPRKLVLEFTERAMFGPVEETLAKMSALKARGVCFALDDFGIGFSSLACLKSLPLDQLKIDRSFVRDVLTKPSDAIIASAIIALAQSLGLAVIAEGVETEEQRQFLSHHGCHGYQGFLFGRPGPVDELKLIATAHSPVERQTFGSPFPVTCRHSAGGDSEISLKLPKKGRKSVLRFQKNSQQD